MKETADEKIARYRAAMEQFVDRVKDDRYVLAVVLVGSLNPETIWRRESLWFWVIEADGVTRRLRSDGNDERIFRVLAEDDINLHAEIIPRSRFKQMVEGSSRTAFSCNFFAHRELVYCDDPSIGKWFETANNVAVKDKEKELVAFSAWTIHAHKHAQKRLQEHGDLVLANQEILDAAHSIAYTQIIRAGQIVEGDVIYHAIDSDPELFQTIYLDVLGKRKNKKVMQQALDAIEAYLQEHYRDHFKPLLALLKKRKQIVPLSEISDHFAFSQLYPWHLLSACDWLSEHGHMEKLSAPFKLTKRSQEEVEEPAYLLD